MKFAYTILAAAASIALGAEPAPAQIVLPVPPPAPEQFLQGVWDTSRGAVAPIVVGIPPNVNIPPLLIQAGFSDDPTAVTYRVETDRGPSLRNLPEGSSAIVEGRSVEIRQAVSGTASRGWWVAIAQPREMAGVTTATWSLLPGASAQILDLAEPRLIVLTLDAPRFAPYCGMQAHGLTVTLDGQPLKQKDGTAVKLTIQNSVITYGKQVAVTLAGTCQPPNPQDTRFFGMIKIANLR